MKPRLRKTRRSTVVYWPHVHLFLFRKGLFVGFHLRYRRADRLWQHHRVVLFEPSRRPPINTWAKIELFGHQRLTGHLAETRVAGKRFLKVTVPEHTRHEETIPASSKLYSPNAVYALTEISEEQALADLQEGVPF